MGGAVIVQWIQLYWVSVNISTCTSFRCRILTLVVAKPRGNCGFSVHLLRRSEASVWAARLVARVLICHQFLRFTLISGHSVQCEKRLLIVGGDAAKTASLVLCVYFKFYKNDQSFLQVQLHCSCTYCSLCDQLSGHYSTLHLFPGQKQMRYSKYQGSRALSCCSIITFCICIIIFLYFK